MRRVPLTQGKFAIVDDEDYERVIKNRWYLAVRGKIRKINYAACSAPGGKTLLMHRLIMNICDRKISIDHKDHNGLNNTKSNLRTCTSSQNNYNSIKTTGVSMFRGVSWDKKRNRWHAQIKKENKIYHLGRYKNEVDAGIAYNKKATELHGEFATLNVIN